MEIVIDCIIAPDEIHKPLEQSSLSAAFQARAPSLKRVVAVKGLHARRPAK